MEFKILPESTPETTIVKRTWIWFGKLTWFQATLIAMGLISGPAIMLLLMNPNFAVIYITSMFYSVFLERVQWYEEGS